MTQRSDEFNFFIPCDIEKSKNKKGEDVMRVKGIASTPDEDSQGEYLDPKGFDLSRFVDSGYINYNHFGKTDPGMIIGEPDKAEVTNKGLYIEGFLYNGSAQAKRVWELGNILNKSSKNRKLGWSIEGRAIQRDPINPKKITKALITGVAITPSPVNKNTFVDIVKGEQKEDFIEYQYDVKKNENGDFLLEIEKGGKTYVLRKDFTLEEVTKAMTTSNTAPLIPESLDKEVKDVAVFKGMADSISKAIELDILTDDQKYKAKNYLMNLL